MSMLLCSEPFLAFFTLTNNVSQRFGDLDFFISVFILYVEIFSSYTAVYTAAWIYNLNFATFCSWIHKLWQTQWHWYVDHLSLMLTCM